MLLEAKYNVVLNPSSNENNYFEYIFIIMIQDSEIQ